MRTIQISHYTEYQYPAPVTLQDHRLMLRPREGHDVRIVSSTLAISPGHQIKWHRDVFDNSVAVVSFFEPAQCLAITSQVVIEHYETAPLDFLVADYAVNFPFDYLAEESLDLQPYQQPAYPADQPAVRQWLDACGFDREPVESYALLDRMNRTITADFTYVVRYEPGVQPPSQTLQQRSGSCRDFAALFCEAARALGLACRFVSGYLHAPATEAGNAATHAWAEVYLPGPGWKGFDPTIGEVTGSKHIPVAVARHPESVPPVAGSFFGPTGPTPALIVNVQVSAL